MEEDKNIIIQKLNQSLEGVGELNGFSYSFRYANIGDEIIFFTIGKRKRKRIIVKEHKIHNLEESPRCKHFYKCGGCSAQHLPYQKQFNLKTRSLARYYSETHNVQSILIPAQRHYHYRNRMDFAVFPDIVGLRKYGDFRTIVDIERCEIQSEWANQELSICKNLLNQFKGIAYDRKLETGYLKYITLRYGVNTQDSMTIFTFCKEFESSDMETQLIGGLIQKSIAEHIVFCYNDKKSEVSAIGKHKTIKGNDSYIEKVCGKTFFIPFDSFFQPNPNGFLPILDKIEDYIKAIDVNVMLDFFCGNGFFSLIFGKYFEEIYGFENVESSIQLAKRIVKDKYPNKKIEFNKYDLFQKKLEMDFLTERSKTLAILDPPRNGLGKKLLSSLDTSNIPFLLYVSCNPNQQKEDISLLANYDLESILFTDPFPHTPHFESIAILVKR